MIYIEDERKVAKMRVMKVQNNFSLYNNILFFSRKAAPCCQMPNLLFLMILAPNNWNTSNRVNK